jgi:hypothetical protein
MFRSDSHGTTALTQPSFRLPAPPLHTLRWGGFFSFSGETKGPRPQRGGDRLVQQGTCLQVRCISSRSVGGVILWDVFFGCFFRPSGAECLPGELFEFGSGDWFGTTSPVAVDEGVPFVGYSACPPACS